MDAVGAVGGKNTAHRALDTPERCPQASTGFITELPGDGRAQTFLQNLTYTTLGGLVAWAASRFHRRRAAAGGAAIASPLAVAKEQGDRSGLLFAAGLIAGEALVGILMAIPIVLAGRGDVLAFWGEFASPWPGVVLLLLVMLVMYRVAVGPIRRVTREGAG